MKFQACYLIYFILEKDNIINLSLHLFRFCFPFIIGSWDTFFKTRWTNSKKRTMNYFIILINVKILRCYSSCSFPKASSILRCLSKCICYLPVRTNIVYTIQNNLWCFSLSYRDLTWPLVKHVTQQGVDRPSVFNRMSHILPDIKKKMLCCKHNSFDTKHTHLFRIIELPHFKVGETLSILLKLTTATTTEIHNYFI